ncbi:MAG TPA: Holliday junction branch migration protein RuvA [Gammaproteobacteria bacterium]|nr:Holliday junction branch migration protein RuvA [Gammaproteobacteria bacterium]
MIGRLTGKLAEKQPPLLLLDVNGVGYELEAPMSTFYTLPEAGQEVVLHTHLVVRDDAHLLYGFSSCEERHLFRALIRISGVGPKLALTILSGISVADFARSVQDDDAARLVRMPGIGKKTAQRLIVEMRDRLPANLKGDGLTPSSVPAAGSSPVGGDARQDACSALESLGYKAQEASRLVSGINCDGLSSEEIIRSALKRAMR